MLLISILCILSCCTACFFLYSHSSSREGTTFYINDSGYYDLLLDYQLVNRYPGTQSLFINNLFVKKIWFQNLEETNLRVPVYFNKGKNTVTICCQEGDDEIHIQNLKYEKRDRPIKMIIVPHQDDEILGFSASIYNMIAAGDDVRVMFATNGDYQGADMGRLRLSESANALSLFGIPQENLILLGYPDAGLADMIKNPKKPVEALSGKKHTYADPDNYFFDYHMMQHGTHAELTKKNFQSDLLNVLTAVRPAEIYVTSRHDNHTDHAFLCQLVIEAIEALQKKNGYAPLLHESIIHSYSDQVWPERTEFDEDGDPVAVPFTNPYPDGGYNYNWEAATHIQTTPEILDIKEQAIDMFYSQNEIMGWADYNYAFLKADEFYWTTDFSK